MIYVTGDLHGEIEVAQKYAENVGAGDTLIIAGDFGAPWYFTDHPNHERFDRPLLKLLASCDFTVAFVDGNHENYTLLSQYPTENRWGGRVQNVEGVYHLLRGEHYTMDDGTTIFTFGGATSVDKAHRTEGVSWWPQEVCSDEEVDRAYRTLERCNWTVDYVITHTAPAQFAALYRGIDYRKDQIRCKTADFLSILNEKLTYKKWYFGHFHHDVNTEVLRARLLFDDVVPLGD